MKYILLLIVFCISMFQFGCAHQSTNYQDTFLSAAPRSILVVPVVNNSVDVTAADYMLSTVAIPLAERGFYVFPTNLVKRVLEDDGLADSSMVHAAPASKLASLFGADAVLYINIERWDAQYAVLNTYVTVALSYEIRDGKTNAVIWQNRAGIRYQSGGGGGGGIGGLIAQAVVAAVTKAAPNYMPLARQANINALYQYPGTGIPWGPYATAQELATQSAENRTIKHYKTDYETAVDSQDYSSAMNILDTSIMVNPNDAKSYFERGKLYYRASRYPDALSNYNKAIALNPNYADAFFERSKIYKGSDSSKYIEDLNAACKLKSKTACDTLASEKVAKKGE